jgi:hypothetical protein
VLALYSKQLRRHGAFFHKYFFYNEVLMPILLKTTIRGKSPLKAAVAKLIFDRLYIDTATGQATAYFTKYIAEVKQDGDIIFNVGPNLVGPLLYAKGDGTKTRSADIANAVYELAIQQGWFEGVII